LKENGGKRGRFIDKSKAAGEGDHARMGRRAKPEGDFPAMTFTRVSEEDCDKSPVVIMSDITCRKRKKLGKSLHSIASNYNI